MHELSLVMSIVEIADEQAKAHDAHHIEIIELEIGTLAGIEIEAFQFAWDVAVVDTVLEKAERIIHHIPAKAKCLDCGLEYDVQQLFKACPICGAYFNNLLQGKELRVKSLTVS